MMYICMNVPTMHLLLLILHARTASCLEFIQNGTIVRLINVTKHFNHIAKVVTIMEEHSQTPLRRIYREISRKFDLGGIVEFYKYMMLIAQYSYDSFKSGCKKGKDCTTKSVDYFESMEMQALRLSDAVVTNTIHRKQLIASKAEAVDKYYVLRQIYHPWHSFDMQTQKKRYILSEISKASLNHNHMF